MESADALDEAEERAFWMTVSEYSLRAIWDNSDDDVYARLLDGPTSRAAE